MTAAASKNTVAYQGHRGTRGAGKVEVVTATGQRALTHHVRHSPTGFEWGYAGSGPADLARSLLADRIGWPPPASVYQRFKRDVVARLDRGGFRLPVEAVDAWLADHYPRRDQLADRRDDVAQHLEELHGGDCRHRHDADDPEVAVCERLTGELAAVEAEQAHVAAHPVDGGGQRR